MTFLKKQIRNFLLIFIVFSCTTSKTKVLTTEGQKEIIILREAKNILVNLNEKNYRALISQIHPTEGVRFSPYGYVNVKDHLHFTKETFTNQLSENRALIWGYTYGKGYPIQLDTEGYISKYVYNANYLQAEKGNYNEIIQSGNSLFNMDEVYPNSYFVEYNFSGFDK